MNIIYRFILLLIILNANLIFAQTKIPQRIIFLDTTTDKNYEITKYIEKEIKKILEILDSELYIRYLKPEEYTNFIDLLYNINSYNMKKFYFNTNARGGISFFIKENNEEYIIEFLIYNFNFGSINKKEFSINKSRIIEEIEGFNTFVRNEIINNFPNIEAQKIEKEKFVILKLVREMPDFAFTLKGDIGYSSKFIDYKIKLKNSDDNTQKEYHNGFNIGIGIEGKLKLFHIGTGINFFPYIVVNNNEFFFDLTGYFDMGLYLIQEILLIKVGSYGGILSGYDFKNENTRKIIPTLVFYLEFGAYPTKYIYPFFVISAGLNFYNMSLNDDLFSILINTNLYGILILKFGFNFYFKNNFFIGMNSSIMLTIINQNTEFDFTLNNKNYAYQSNTSKNEIIFSFGYRLERGEKK